jgi:hypothetical protein
MKTNLRLQRISFLIAGMTAIALAVSAQAGQTVLVDFGSNGSFRGASVVNPDSLGHHWNSITPGAFITNMIDTGNNVTTIDLGFSTPVGTDSFNGPAGVTSFPPTPAEVAATDVDTAALGNLGGSLAGPFDFAASAGGADNRTRFEIQQLDPAKRYNLTFFGSHKFSDNDATVYSVYSDNTYSTLVASGSLNVQTPGSPNLHNRDKVLTLANLAPQASNIFYVQFVGAGGGLGYLNDMQIAVIPEPSAILLLMSGGTGLIFGRKRR